MNLVNDELASIRSTIECLKVAHRDSKGAKKKQVAHLIHEYQKELNERLNEQKFDI